MKVAKTSTQILNKKSPRFENQNVTEICLKCFLLNKILQFITITTTTENTQNVNIIGRYKV